MSIGTESGRGLPRFAALAADEVNARVGPGQRYPIAWVYRRKHLPVQIIREFDTWRKIRDQDGEESWVHWSLLSGTRYAVTRAPGDQAIQLHQTPDQGSRILALVDNGVVMRLHDCEGGWCHVESDPYDGWINADHLYGD